MNTLPPGGLCTAQVGLGGSAPSREVTLPGVLSVLFMFHPICAKSTGHYDYINSLNSMQTNEM